jgi:hypothetical protein
MDAEASHPGARRGRGSNLRTWGGARNPDGHRSCAHAAWAAHSAVMPLLSDVRDEMNADRQRPVELAQAAPASRDALRALVDARSTMTLRHDDLPLIELAARVPGLAELLDEVPLDPDAPGAWTAWERAQRVVQLLGEIGPAADGAIPRLMFWMKRDPRGLGPLVADALGRIGGAAAIRELNTWLSGEDRKRPR